MESEEARKALDLARKHDLGGNTDGALKWARKSVAIYSTREATELVARLEVHGASGKASGESAPEASATSTATAPATGATKRNTAPASSGASEGKREYTEAQIQIVRRVKRAGGDFYSVLDIEKSADENQVKKSYRKVRLVYMSSPTHRRSSLCSCTPTRIGRPARMKRSSVRRGPSRVC